LQNDPDRLVAAQVHQMMAELGLEPLNGAVSGSEGQSNGVVRLPGRSGLEPI
jgi:hypothetical protein